MRLLRRLFVLSLIACVSIPAVAQTPPPAANDTKLLRFPTTNGSQIVFTYAGDLYTVAAMAASRGA